MLAEYTQFELVLFYLGVGSTLFFVGQFIMTAIGMDGHGDVDVSHDVDFSHDHDGTDHDNSSDSSFRIFTLKNIIGFLIGISWGTLAMHREFGLSQWPALAVGAVMGFLIMVLQSTVFWLMIKLDAPNNESTAVTEGTTGEVYLPFNEDGLGKVQITLNGAVRTVSARINKGATGSYKVGDPIIVTKVEGEVPYVSPVEPFSVEEPTAK